MSGRSAEFTEQAIDVVCQPVRNLGKHDGLACGSFVRVRLYKLNSKIPCAGQQVPARIAPKSDYLRDEFIIMSISVQ
ncbi:MAG: hypothetical protein RLZZ298_497 [Pseudomonadota bacterium]